jgi:hypothetical protein
VHVAEDTVRRQLLGTVGVAVPKLGLMKLQGPWWKLMRHAITEA